MNAHILTGDDVRYLAQQPDSEVGMMLGQMTTLIQNINDLQQDTDDKVKLLENQGWFKRMTNTLFGKNKATKQEIQKNNDKVVTYVSQSVAVLYDMNLVNERIICSLGNRMNEIYMQVTGMYQEQLNMKAQISQILAVQQQTLEAMGAFVRKLNEKIESVDNFHMLITEIERGMYNDSSRLFNLCSILSQLDKRQMDDSRKMNLLRDTMARSGVITDGEFTVLRCLQEIIALPTEKVGPIYLELCSFRQSFPANLFADMIESYHFLSKMEKMTMKKDIIIQRVMDKYMLDPNAAFSIADITDSFIESKQDSLVAFADIPQTTDQQPDSTDNSETDSSELKDNITTLYYSATDRKIVYEHLKPLAENGNIVAQYYLGRLLLEPDTSYHNRDLAISTLTLSAEAGDYDSQLLLAQIYEGSTIGGFEKDEKKQKESIKWYRISANNPNADLEDQYFSKMILARKLYKYGSLQDKDESLRIMLELYDTDPDPSDAFDIAECYRCHVKNNEEALKWYQIAADKGFVAAKRELALMYIRGEAGAKNYTKAFKLLQQAAEANDDKAMCALGRMYQDGYCGSQNYAKANEWYRKAIILGNADAKAFLGLNYWHGNGVAKNEELGAQLLKEAASEGSEYVDERMQSIIYGTAAVLGEVAGGLLNKFIKFFE